MCKRLTKIFPTFFQDAGQVNSRTSFYEQFEWKRNCESELDKFLSHQTSDITCVDLMLMREIVLAHLRQRSTLKFDVWYRPGDDIWHFNEPINLWTSKCSLRVTIPPPPPHHPRWRKPTANLMIKSPEKSFFNQQTASHNDVEAQSSELSEVGGSKPVLNSMYFWF